MKRLIIISIVAIAAACGGTATNNSAPAASKTDAPKPTASAPTAETMFAMEKQATEAWIKGDKAFFENMMSDKFVSFEQGRRTGKSDTLGMIGTYKCEMRSWDLSEPQMAKINDDTYAMTSKGTFDGSCTGADGKAMKIPSPVRAVSIYVRDGDKWKGAYHGETMIIDPKNPPPAPPKAEAPKKDAETVKKEELNKPTPGANTDALVKLHTGGWEAFKAKDAKAFGDLISSNMALVDPIGGYMSGKDAVIKQWTETMKCEGITKTAVTDGFASALSPSVELLTVKGTADGKCDGQPNGPLWQMAVYVKEGEAWKLAFMQEWPGM